MYHTWPRPDFLPNLPHFCTPVLIHCCDTGFQDSQTSSWGGRRLKGHNALILQCFPGPLSMVSHVKSHTCSKLQDGEVKGILRQRGKMQRKAALICNSDPSPKNTSCLLSSCSHHSNVPHLVRVPQTETVRAYMRIQTLEGCGFFCFVRCSNPSTQNSNRPVGGPWN